MSDEELEAKSSIGLKQSYRRVVEEHRRNNQPLIFSEIRAISEKLQRDMPGLRGFGYENLNKMRQFYETWLPYLIGSPSATQLESSENRSPSATR